MRKIYFYKNFLYNLTGLCRNKEEVNSRRRVEGQIAVWMFEKSSGRILLVLNLKAHNTHNIQIK